MKRRSVSVVGAQWGDEGKGKIVDLLAFLARQESQYSGTGPKPILVKRFQGGGNAGHTLVVDGETHKLHLTPSGILHREAYNLVGQQVFFNPRIGMAEFQGLIGRGVEISAENLGIAANTHMTLDYHVQADQAAYELERHTTTGNGIKQTAADKQNRVGVRFVEFLDPQWFKEALMERNSQWVYAKHGSLDAFVDSYSSEREFLQQFLTQEHVADRIHGTCYVIWEGAQGVMLDVDLGQYPSTTSSNPGFIPGKVDLRLGVLKLYTSSAGTGKRPFVPQIGGDLEEELREAWGEFGTTTGKPRDVGWFDAVAARYAVEAANIDYVVGTCGDKLEYLSALGVKPRIVVGYQVERKIHLEWDSSFHKRGYLHQATPVFEEFEPWNKFTEEDGQTLTPNAQTYVNRIEQLTGRKFVILGTGPAQHEMIVRENPFDLI